jgi:ketosteroid isomerase-like protein
MRHEEASLGGAPPPANTAARVNTKESIMSAATNKQLMQEVFAKVAAGDGSMFRERLADDVVIHITGQFSWARSFHGKESVLRDLFGAVRRLIEGPLKTIPTRFLADEDLVVVEGRGDMWTKAGQRYDNHYCLIYRLRDGMIVEGWEYQDSTLVERVLGSFPQAAA